MAGIEDLIAPAGAAKPCWLTAPAEIRERLSQRRAMDNDLLLQNGDVHVQIAEWRRALSVRQVQLAHEGGEGKPQQVFDKCGAHGDGHLCDFKQSP